MDFLKSICFRFNNCLGDYLKFKFVFQTTQETYIKQNKFFEQVFKEDLQFEIDQMKSDTKLKETSRELFDNSKKWRPASWLIKNNDDLIKKVDEEQVREKKQNKSFSLFRRPRNSKN